MKVSKYSKLKYSDSPTKLDVSDILIELKRYLEVAQPSDASNVVVQPSRSTPKGLVVDADLLKRIVLERRKKEIKRELAVRQASKRLLRPRAVSSGAEMIRDAESKETTANIAKNFDKSREKNRSKYQALFEAIVN
jgi:hypothetical protein